ncbi:carbohydrate binding domain-containing protein [Vallitalea pronyensis]|uniref:Carbohydrate binding domain-containing protein n=1 Tax=Vallitalea pronyensis TaxID=1348613 RepID=A0A8J8MIY4_9FIRM|nr:carbohydrate binding domain-containing protein [Vallitalea pronyensis]QUI22494.1 carbohydrate binding domain-containing protein [Vallitalea pronyensis]
MKHLKKIGRVAVILLMSFCIFRTVYAQDAGILNSDFEKVDVKSGAITHWTYDAWQQRETANYSIHKGDAKSGDYFIAITHLEDNDSRLIQKVKVQELTTYKLSVWVKAAHIPSQHIGGSIAILEDEDIPNSIRDTDGEWQLLEQTFDTDKGQTEVTVALRLGFYGHVTKGMIAFDDVRIQKLGIAQPVNAKETHKHAFELKVNGIPVWVYLSTIIFILASIFIKKKSLKMTLQR